MTLYFLYYNNGGREPHLLDIYPSPSERSSARERFEALGWTEGQAELDEDLL